MLTSKGASGLTGAGFITLAALSLILGIDRFMSESRAITNIIGNAVATIVISHSEQELDRAKLHAALNNRSNN